jgi:hypothetical protein
MGPQHFKADGQKDGLLFRAKGMLFALFLMKLSPV